MIPREYMDKMAALREENRQLRAMAFGTELALPIEWKLSRTESALMRCLIARETVTWDTWSTAVPNSKAGPATMKVHVAHLRKKLKPFGITVHLRHGVGYSLDPAVRTRLKVQQLTGLAA